jgi:prolipoprotein diacylglyceryltransferase
MYPNLSYLFHDLFGTPVDNGLAAIQMFGLMLGVAVFIAGLALFFELRRFESLGMLLPTTQEKTIGAAPNWWAVTANALFGFFMGYKVVYLIQHISDISDPVAFLPKAEGNLVAGIIGAIALGGYKWYDDYRQQLPTPKKVIEQTYPHQRTWDIAIVAALTGLLGAKLFASFESAEAIAEFVSDPIGTFFSGSGLAMYGGLAGGTLGVMWYIRKHKIPVRVMMDAAAPALMLGYAVGRIGCQLSGDGDWGIAAGPQPAWWFLPDWMWAYDYPHNVSNFVDERGLLHYADNAEVIEGFKGKYNSRLEPKVYPTPFYETVMCLILFGVLWAIRKRIKITGSLFFIYLILNGIERFFIEKIRVNDKIHAFGITFTQAELIAVLLVLIGSAGLVVLNLEHRRKSATA